MNETFPAKNRLMPYAICAQIVILAVGAFLMATMWWKKETELPRREALAETLKDTGYFQRLWDLSIIGLTLTCDESSKRVKGTFDFVELEGRTPVTVSSDTICSTPGKMLNTGPGWIFARENYMASLVTSETEKLITSAKLTPHLANRSNEKLAEELTQEYGKIGRARDYEEITFMCDKAGEPYEYRARDYPRYANGELNTTCTQAHQNFKISIGGLNSNTLLTYKVQEYNEVPAAQIKRAYAEYLGAGEPRASF